MISRTEMAALRKLNSDKFREVPQAMVEALAAKGLCTVAGSITDAGAAHLPQKRMSFTLSAHLYRMSMRPSWNGKRS